MQKPSFYWIQIKRSLLKSDNVKYLISQNENNGFVYVILYQALCLISMNSSGVFDYSNKEKLVKDLQYFTLKQIEDGIKYFIKLRLIAKQRNGCLKIRKIDKIVYSDCAPCTKRNQERKEAKERIKETQLTFYKKVSKKIKQDKTVKELKIRKLLQNYCYLTEEELTSETYDELIASWIETYGYTNTLVHIKYFLNQVTDLLPTDKYDENGVLVFKRSLKEINALRDSDSKYVYFKKSIERGFKRIGGE